MIINFTRKLSLSMAIVLFAAFAISGQAFAKDKKTDITFQNRTGFTVNIENLTWSGSYWPQMTTPVADGTNATGQHKTVLEFGHGGLTFETVIDAPNDPEDGQRCLFTFNVSNSNHNLTLVSKSALVLGSTCEIILEDGRDNFALFPNNEVIFEMR